MEFGRPRKGLRWVSGFEVYSFDTVEGWSVLIHPDTGEWIISGRRSDTPLTVKEKEELKDALRKALLKAYPKKVWEKEEFHRRLDAEVEHRPKMGETPVLLSDDVVEQIPADLRGGVRVRYREREVFYRVRGEKLKSGAQVWVSWRRGLSGVLDSNGALVAPVVAVFRPDPPGRRVFPQFDAPVVRGWVGLPDGAWLEVGDAVAGSGETFVRLRSDPDELITATAMDGTSPVSESWQSVLSTRSGAATARGSCEEGRTLGLAGQWRQMVDGGFEADDRWRAGLPVELRLWGGWRCGQ